MNDRQKAALFLEVSAQVANLLVASCYALVLLFIISQRVILVYFSGVILRSFVLWKFNEFFCSIFISKDDEFSLLICRSLLS